MISYSLYFNKFLSTCNFFRTSWKMGELWEMGTPCGRLIDWFTRVKIFPGSRTYLKLLNIHSCQIKFSVKFLSLFQKNLNLMTPVHWKSSIHYPDKNFDDIFSVWIYIKDGSFIEVILWFDFDSFMLIPLDIIYRSQRKRMKSLIAAVRYHGLIN